MAKTMIALVSAQRMQNIIPVFQKGADFDKIWLVRSTDADVAVSRFARAWQDTVNALKGDLDVHSAEPAVGAYGIAETRQLVAGLIEEGLPDDVVVNFTGGTKCMSVGAYLAAQNVGVTTLYVDTANEKLVWFSEGQRQEERFDLAGRLTVSVYFRANGKQIDQKRTQKHALPEIAYDIAREFASTWPQCVDTLEAFGRAISHQGQDKVQDSLVNRGIVDILAQYELVTQTGTDWEVREKGRAFLTGKWLEALVCVLLESSGHFDDVQSGLCLREVENELDVLTTRKGQLAIIECKSGSLGGQTTLNKLQAIRTGFGTFARTFFVTSQQDNRVKHDFRERAREYGVRQIITAESLLQIADKVRTGMRGTP
ncbi:MAG TPA: DUF1887 family protein [Chloroflexi bacterium]|nr:DUF1887 family protein [Chloroflexota bacterium]